MYGVPMDGRAGLTRGFHKWHTSGPWMMCKRRKKPIGNGKLVGLVPGLGRKVSKPKREAMTRT
jgi:hypothetical protein